MIIFSKIIITIAVIALLTAVQPACVFACSCVPSGPTEQALADATAVFSGRVTVLTTSVNVGEYDRGTVTFAVIRSWKGVDQTTIVLISSPSSSCDFGFVEHEEYLVYAYGSEDQLATGYCTRTAPLDMAGEDLATLGLGTAPDRGVGILANLPATAGNPTYHVHTVLAAGTLMVAMGAVLTMYQSIRRNRHN